MPAVAELPPSDRAEGPSANPDESAPPPGCVAEAELGRFHEWATDYIALQVERGLPVSSVGKLWRQWNAPPLPAPKPATAGEIDWTPLPPHQSWGDVLEELGIAGPPVVNPLYDAAEAEANDPMAGFGTPGGGVKP